MTKTNIALITGASSGIGLSCAKKLLAQGYKVVGISRRGEVKELSDKNFVGLSLDISDIGAIDKLMPKLVKQYNFDVFIHCAGAGSFGSIEQFSNQQIVASINTNLTSALILSHSLIPAFRRQRRGRMIFIGSESALAAGKKGCLYSAAKFGLRGFCQALGEDCGKHGIQVSLINPGMVRSPFFDELSFEPAEAAENAIRVEDIADQVWHIMQSSPNLVIGEININPRVKSIHFKPKQ